MPISLFGLFENAKPLVIAGSVKGLSLRMDGSHSLPLLQLSPCECRTCQVTVLTEEHLNMRPNLGHVRRRVIEYVPNVQSDWGRSAGVLYTVPTVLVPCGLQDSKTGCAAAQDEGLIQFEQYSVGG
jgi:hypothetical protein